jgi:hypothetical protein
MDGWQNVVSSVALTDLLVRYARPLSAQCAWYPLAQRSASEAGAMLCSAVCSAVLALQALAGLR